MPNAIGNVSPGIVHGRGMRFQPAARTLEPTISNSSVPLFAIHHASMEGTEGILVFGKQKATKRSPLRFTQ